MDELIYATYSTGPFYFTYDARFAEVVQVSEAATFLIVKVLFGLLNGNYAILSWLFTGYPGKYVLLGTLDGGRSVFVEWGL